MLKAGDTFGPYRAIKSLGKGGMGEVWLLQHEANGYLFAVKILSDENATSRDSRRRFVREAQLAMSVNHDNLVRVYDVGEDPDTGLCYILMEYVAGGTLRDRIKAQGCLPVDQALRIVRGIASVLEAAQTKQVVHRDIKPDNILFTTEGTPKLSDLGIARVTTDKVFTTVTVDGSVIGTPAYMAPEQMIDSHHVDVRADIYSLGIVLFEMLAGRRPNQDEGLVQMMARAVQRKEIIDIRNYRRSVPEPVANLLRRMCAAKVEERIASPRQIVNLCTSLLGEKASVAAPRRVGGLAEASPIRAVGLASRRVVAAPARTPQPYRPSANVAGRSAAAQPEKAGGLSPAAIAAIAVVVIIVLIAICAGCTGGGGV